MLLKLGIKLQGKVMPIMRIQRLWAGGFHDMEAVVHRERNAHVFGVPLTFARHHAEKVPLIYDAESMQLHWAMPEEIGVRPDTPACGCGGPRDPERSFEVEWPGGYWAGHAVLHTLEGEGHVIGFPRGLREPGLVPVSVDEYSALFLWADPADLCFRYPELSYVNLWR